MCFLLERLSEGTRPHGRQETDLPPWTTAAGGRGRKLAFPRALTPFRGSEHESRASSGQEPPP
jgi:hypothetical protein